MKRKENQLRNLIDKPLIPINVNGTDIIHNLHKIHQK